MNAKWGHLNEPDRIRWYASCTECGYVETTDLLGADGVMTVASLSAQHNNNVHAWDELKVPQ